ncbi:MAG TPA: GNAT family N-acetyltransferase [Vicinamibacteria bacterium]|nr:GNAT family N-acetyltransferase [Vicinamibacteria bacterium]
MPILVRPAEVRDEEAVLSITRELAADGTTYVFEPDTSDDALRAYWLAPGGRNFVAERDGVVAGCYVLRANHAGRGAHVANASYAVASRAWGTGVGRAMAEHSLEQARAAGFEAMQFNLVVSTNERAVALWKALGFAIVGTLPRVFRHPRLGLVDAYVMHRFL